MAPLTLPFIEGKTFLNKSQFAGREFLFPNTPFFVRLTNLNNIQFDWNWDLPFFEQDMQMKFHQWIFFFDR